MLTPVTDLLSDARLVQHARSGAPDALRELYERYGVAVYRLAYRLSGSAADAEDVLQDVFVGLPEALRRFDGRGSLEGWIKRVAARTALMRLRREGRRREVALDALPLSSTVSAPEHVVEAAALERAMASLPEALRVVFVLREVEGYTHTEIGELLGIRRGTSEVRHHRARRALQELLRSES